MSFFEPPQLIQAEVFASVPAALSRKGHPSSWIDANHPGAALHCFLEGPAIDRHGNLYMVDIPYGRILRMSPAGEFDVAAQYDGWPNGLAIHKDGRIFIADYRLGIMVLDPASGRVEPYLTHAFSESFKGVNDLTFALNGDLYFTDQGQSALEDPSGRVFRLRATGELDLLFKGLAGPNGLVLNKQENLLYVAVTRANQIISIPLLADHKGVGKCGVFIQLSGSPTGPDGMAIDEDGNLAIVHAGFGTVWVFSRLGEPLFRIKSCAGMRTTNVAFGGAERRFLYITEAEHGVILRAKLPTPGKPMYSHA